jgi:hypothetical protein
MERMTEVQIKKAEEFHSKQMRENIELKTLKETAHDLETQANTLQSFAQFHQAALSTLFLVYKHHYLHRV